MIDRRFLLCAALLWCALGVRAATAQSDAGVASFAEPAVSPDHREIAFVSGGDVWSVPAAGGSAQLLAAVDGYASRPLFSPDGTRLAFVSSRPGASGIYVVTLAGGALTRLTHDDLVPNLSGWSNDGKFVYFSSAAHNIGYDADIMRVAVDGGTPMRVTGELYANANDGVPSPDGTRLAFTRDGFVQWWRHGHSHLDESTIVVERLDTRAYDTITPSGAKDRWPMWSPDGGTLYFVSDRSGNDELWAATGGHLRRLTNLNGEPVLWPSIAHDGHTIAFEHALAIWTFDTQTGAVAKTPITLRGLPDVPAAQHAVLGSRFSALSLSPDGLKLAFVARARIFAASSQDGGDAQALPGKQALAYDLPVWAAGSRRIAYVVDNGLEQAVATYEFPDGPERVLTPPGHHDDYPHWSPDGTLLAFVRDGSELHVLDVATHADRIVARGKLDRRPLGDLGDIAFSPAGDWIAYLDIDALGFTNVRVVRTAGGPSHAISFLPNTNGGPLAWAPDGTRLFFITSQRTEDGQVAEIDLTPRAPRFREDAFRRLFELPVVRPEMPSHPVPSPAPAASATPHPTPAVAPRHTEITFDGIRERLSFLPTGLDVTSVVATPDGKSLLLLANGAEGQSLFAFSIDETSDEPAVARQLTTTPGVKSNVAVTPDGKSALLLDAGRVIAVPLLVPGGAKLVPLAAGVDIDFSGDKGLVFRQAWSTLDRWFADPHFHGADWNAVFRTYEPHALGARTPLELRRIISLMLGELNASHNGIYNPPNPGVPRYVTGRLGAEFDPAEYARSGRLRITQLLPLGPLALAGHVEPGDDLIGVAGTPIARDADLDALLANRIGMRTELRIAPHGDASAARSVVVLPIDEASEQELRYRAWVASRRAYVERVSGGRLGYVHLFDMSSEALAKFALDLDVQNREKEGVVVDVRGNEGGFVDPYAIDVLARREYARFETRFFPDASERTQLGQRALDKPTLLVTNAQSLSDAENFTEAFRVLGVGPVVGEPTAGWIIFTGATTLADGSTLRLPITRVIGHDGVDMELHPRPVDVRAADPPGAAEHGDDPQLDAAVRTLLQRVRH